MLRRVDKVSALRGCLRQFFMDGSSEPGSSETTGGALAPVTVCNAIETHAIDSGRAAASSDK